MSADRALQAWINPLVFIDADEALGPKEVPSVERLLEYLCTPSRSSQIGDMVERYGEISGEVHRLFMAPAEKNVLERLVWPLQHAVADYMIGNYLGTIAMSGIVAEMLSIFIFDLSHVSINGRVMTDSDQRGLFGSSFEKLSQDRRVSVLRTYELINDDMKAAFDTIRTKRRKYLHLFSQSHDKVAEDAVGAFSAAVTLVARFFIQDVKQGEVQLLPAMIRYLEDRGIFEVREISDVTGGEAKT